MLLRNIFLLLCCFTSSAALAERWFEVEVLIFKQRPAPYLQEDFSLKHDEIKDNNTLDLLSPIYNEQAIEACINGDKSFQRHTSELPFLAHTNDTGCDSRQDPLTGLNTLPVVPAAPAQEGMEQPYLLAPEQLEFTEQRRSLSNKGLTPLLHTGWRFEGQSKAQAPSIHLFAGKQLERIQNGRVLPHSANDFVSLVDLTNPVSQETANWELDGLFKIHLRHYLYISADFDMKQPLPNGNVELARFSQFKRVISSEIHYFDHPRMGMIVQIRKFNH